MLFPKLAAILKICNIMNELFERNLIKLSVLNCVSQTHIIPYVNYTSVKKIINIKNNFGSTIKEEGLNYLSMSGVEKKKYYKIIM